LLTKDCATRFNTQIALKLKNETRQKIDLPTEERNFHQTILAAKECGSAQVLVNKWGESEGSIY
jgi:hypothetical protein